jgi:hypothetical protein
MKFEKTFSFIASNNLYLQDSTQPAKSRSNYYVTRGLWKGSSLLPPRDLLKTATGLT